LSSVDKTITNAYYEVEIDSLTKLPVSIKAVVLSGTRGGTEAKGMKIIGGKHVAFHFQYEICSFGELKRPAVPPEALKQLAKL